MHSGSRTESEGPADLTGAQHLLWTGQQLHPDVPLYNMAFTFEIEGQLDADTFRAAFSTLIEQVEALRSVIRCVEGVPQQSVLDDFPFELDLIDLEAAGDPAAALAEWAQERCERMLDLEARTFDSALVRMGPDRWAWYLNQHHAITDAWSSTVLFARLSEIYGRLESNEDTDLPPLTSYETYRAFEAKTRSETKAHPHWRARHASMAPRIDFYGRRPPSIGTANERVEVEIGPERLERLRALARDPACAALTEDLALFRLVATVLFIHLHRVTAQDTVRIGALAHNRLTKGFKQSAGLFTELLPLQVDLDANATFLDVLASVRDETDAYLRAALPGASDAASSRSINTVLNFIRGTFGDFAGRPATPTWLHPDHVDAEHHLRVQVYDFSGSGRLRFAFDFNTDVFDAAQRAAAIDHFLGVLDEFLEDWSKPIATFPLGGGASPPPPPLPPAPSTTVVDMFRSCAADHADDVAVACGDRRLTYRDLDRQTDALAAQILASGDAGCVGILLPRSVEAVAAMVAALKSGRPYVPLDPAWPSARLERVREDAGITTVLHDDGSRSLAGADGIRVSLGEALESPPPSPPPPPTTRDVAYVMYTSGSTGQPKGVVIDHAALAHYVSRATEQYGRGLVFPLFSPLTFDLTVTSLYVPLVSGGSIVVYPETDTRADMAVVHVFEDDAVDIVKLTPSHLSLVADRPMRGARIGQLILGGEDLTERLARRTFEQFGGDIVLHNEYGPTEGTVGCIVATLREPPATTSGSVAIGRAIPGMQAFVLDDGMNEVPDGVVGELAIAGHGLARGYHARPELTAERFVQLGDARLYRTGDRARRRRDGVIEYLGRRDEQVKIRGVRIEPGEIEAALAEHPAIEQCVVDVYQRSEAQRQVADRHCSRCGLASNYPGITFDHDGVCSECRAFESVGPRARAYFQSMPEMEAIFARSRETSTADYDCLALLSGGKDSTYVACRLVDMGLRVLTFTLDNGYISDEAKANIRRVVDTLGVDHVFASTPAMNEIFVDSLERHANVCNGCFKTIYALSLELAREKDIPIIVTGLSRGQFFETRLTGDLFTDLTIDNAFIDAQVLDARKAAHRADDAVRRLLADTGLFDDESVFDEVQFVDFYRYCDVDLDELYAYLDERVPWIRPSDTGRSTNCLINDVGIYVHKHDRGYHNYALPYSWDVRMGHKTREAAMDELDDEIDVDAVHRILREIGYPDDAMPGAGTTRLVAYYVSGDDVAIDALRQHLRSRLPEALVPARFVRMNAIPTTAHGKVDRAALPAPDAASGDHVGSTAPFIAPRTAQERTLCEIWSSVLGIERVGIRDDFFELGGDSIMAIQIVARAHRRRLAVTAGAIFESLTVERLAAAAEPLDESTSGSAITRVDRLPETWEDAARARGIEDVVDAFALSPMQEGMLFHTITEPRPGELVVQISCRVEGRIDVERLRRAWELLVARHAALRTAVLWEDVDEPLQVVRERAVIPWTELDWTDADEAERRQRLESVLRSDRDRDYDPSAAPLVRMILARESEEEWRWILSFHHLALDGWSAATILREALKTYEALAHGSEPAAAPSLPYHEYVKWLAGRDMGATEAFWRAELEGFDTPTRLPSTTGASGSGRHHDVFTLDRETTSALRKMAAANRLTLNTVVQGAWALLLSRWTRECDVVFGVTASVRPPELPGIEEAVGLYINSIPLRARVDRCSTIADWLSAQQRRQLALRAYEFSPLASVQRWSELEAGEQLFESILVFENYPDAGSLDVDGLRIADMDYLEESNYPLAILVVPDDPLWMIFIYDTSRFDAPTIARLSTHLEAILAQFANDPSTLLDDIALTDVAAQRRLLDTDRPDAAEPPSDRLVHELIQDAVQAAPSDVAIVAGDRRVTYAELDAAANDLAHRLVQEGVEPDARVGLFVERSVDMVIGILGILKAGGAYVPLDPSYPAEHVHVLIEQATPRIVLAPRRLIDSLPESGARCVALDAPASAGGAAPTAPPPTATTSDHLAYVIFTSGSTGVPKGVMVSHANLVSSTLAREQVYEEPVGRFLLLSSFSFDSSVAGIFWSLCTGGTLVLPAPGEEQDMDRLLDIIERENVTHLLCLPTLYGLLIEAAEPGCLASLRIAVVAGEACPASVASLHADAVPACALFNEYGPTEATVWATAHRVDPGSDRTVVPIGRAIPTIDAYVLDEALRPVPTGFTGELFLSGRGLARGYLGDAADGNTGFMDVELPGHAPRRMYRTGDLVRARDDGTLEFEGRGDTQVKVRGHRIELSAVDSALRAEPSVADVAVTGREIAGRTRLLAWVVPTASANAGELSASLHDALAARLPAHMVPDVITTTDAIPRTANGKTDHASLPDPLDQAPQPDGENAPRTPDESALVEIWSELLGTPDVGIHDNFFQLGGDSILSIQLISRARQAGLAIEPRQIADHPTIAELASLAGAPADGIAAEEEPVGELELTPIQRWFFELDLAAPHHWNMTPSIDLPAGTDLAALEAAWRACFAQHDALRLRFPLNGGRRTAVVDAAETVAAPWSIVDVEGSSEADRDARAREIVESAQSGFDLERGPLARAIVLRAAARPTTLVIATHHLVVDVVSWWILLDDLELALRQASEGRSIALPPRTTSWGRWSRWQSERAARADATAGPAAIGAIPLDHDRTADATEATTRRVTRRMSPERTESLLSAAHAAYNTRAEDLLLAALAMALERWSGSPVVHVDLESHGRPDDVTGIDLSRTVGWFTAVRTVDVDARTTGNLGSLITRVKERLRTDPALRAEGHAPVLFNYVGRLRSPDTGALGPIAFLHDSSRDPRNARPYVLEVNAAVRGDRLELDLVYSSALHDTATIERIATGIEEALNALVDHCLGAEQRFTPSDFPEAGMDQSELDEFLGSL